MKNFSFKIYNHIAELPNNWDVVAVSNIFLQSAYLQVLENSAPTNMQCFYIGVFEKEELIGVSLAQYLDLNKLESFGERDQCFKTYIRNFIFKKFASHTLFIGNNMITGQNSYAFSKNIDFECISTILFLAAKEITHCFNKKNIKIHLVTFKDFYKDSAVELKKYQFINTYEFNTQPNMIFYFDKNWKSKQDYFNSFSKKYRDQYKRAHKKGEEFTVISLTEDQIVFYEEKLYDLYHYVAKNAPFNTFFLARNHFSTMKKQCQHSFLIFGYFLNDVLVGFHTLLLNGSVLETYFLGYDSLVQKEKMLYLNMLYNMTEYGIENGFEKIIFGRTALEIKSSVGAKPVTMSGFIYHNNWIINRYLSYFFKNLEPKVEWQLRHPFKEME